MRFLSRSEVPVALQIRREIGGQRRYALALLWTEYCGVVAAAALVVVCAAVKARSLSFQSASSASATKRLSGSTRR